MKKKSLLVFLFAGLMFSSLFAQELRIEKAKGIAEKLIQIKNLKANIEYVSDIKSADQKLAYVFQIEGKGFIVTTAQENCMPLLAYSFNNSFDENAANDAAVHFIQNLVLQSQAYFKKHPQKLKASWDSFMKASKDRFFEQWPPEGTTTTGGWLNTNWKQSYPYNTKCPMDLASGGRSIAGCPAVAMAQVLHFQTQTNGTQFTDEDDYYHNYGGNHFWIDNDFEEFSFPSFPELNEYLIEIQATYDIGMPLTNEQKAALVFACGTACKQVYSKNISGT
jgi:Peptidase C10 family/Spi protease inhibitor